MKRKTSILRLAATGFALAFVTPVFAQDSTEPAATIEIAADSLAVAEQIVDLGFPVEKREALFFAAIDQLQGQVREAVLTTLPSEDEGAIAVLDEWIADYSDDGKEILRVHIPKLMEAMAKSYAVMFTHEELTDILAFVSTPSGQRFFELSGAVMAEPHFAEANQNYMNESLANLPEAQADLVQRLLAYKKSKETAEEDSVS